MIMAINIHAVIEPFLHAKWQELFHLFMTDSTLSLKLMVLEKSTSDWIRRGNPARKNYHVLLIQHLSQLSTWSFAGLIPEP